jgi:tRNA nucleotidyltransferase (CCA-adding enzyme)
MVCALCDRQVESIAEAAAEDTGIDARCAIECRPMASLAPNLHATIAAEAIAVCARLREHGLRGWIVGGCVRDLLLGKHVSDWDIATDARPEDVMRIFPKVIPTGIAHGTVTVILDAPDGTPRALEVTTLRGETLYSDGRRPDAVYFVDDIVADLARRDFTVNAIALDPGNAQLIDPFDGQGDLGRRLLRAVGDPVERFAEDGLRVLRAARFTATLEMAIEPATLAAIGPSLDTYRKVSPERVRDEWLKAMRATRPSRAFEVMRTTGILAVTCPELLEGVDMEQNRWHGYDVWHHALACLDACGGDAILRMSALLHDVGKPRTRAFSQTSNDYTFYDHDRVGAEIAEPILARLRFSNDERARIVHLVRHHLFHYTDAWSDAAVRRWLRRVTLERLDDLYRLNEADLRGKGRDFSTELATLQTLKERVERVRQAGVVLNVRTLAISGRDLMHELGMQQGPAIGALLDELLEAVTLEPEINARDELLRRARVIHARR